MQLNHKYTADFETVNAEEDCRVWAWASVKIWDERTYRYGNSIEGFIKWCEESNKDIYFHNLKFDGEFIITWLLRKGYRHVKDKRDLETKTFTTLISDKGQFYMMQIMFKKKGKRTKQVNIYDSYKIIQMSVADMAEAFGLEISKLTIEYNEFREVGHELTKEEIDYIKNDVCICAQSLQHMFELNLTKMTQSSNAMSEYKSIISDSKFKRLFPIPDNDSEIRKSYHGGWTYLKKGCENKLFGEGIVLDINSMYPAKMYNELLPFGQYRTFEGQYESDRYYPLYIQKLVCNFELKEEHLPTILLNRGYYDTLDYCESSDGHDIELLLTNVDLELFFKHYDVRNIAWLGGYKYMGSRKLFKEYIDKWYGIKQEATKTKNKPLRTIAKFMLNTLYGKFGLNPYVASKVPVLINNDVKYIIEREEDRDPVYIAVASFITAYARATVITAAQANYDRFIYADTDSLHMIGTDIPDNLFIDEYALGAWKHESTFTRAKYLRTKCYIEEIDNETVVAVSGMPRACHQYVTFDNFEFGNKFPGKLQQKRVNGGIVLKEIDFTLKSC